MRNREFIVKFTIPQELNAQAADELMRRLKHDFSSVPHAWLNPITISNDQGNEIEVTPENLWLSHT